MNNKFNIKYYAKVKISLPGLDRRNNRNKQSSLLWSVKHSLFVVLVQAVILDNINNVFLLKKNIYIEILFPMHTFSVCNRNDGSKQRLVLLTGWNCIYGDINKSLKILYVSL